MGGPGGEERTDDASGSGAGDARTVVREGLRRVVAAHGEPPPDLAAARAWVNRLLDETGSDRRGLVLLLLRVRDDGVLGEFPTEPQSAAAWAPVRARLAFGYASATYLDAEMARWAVDAWAYALGLIGGDGLWAPPAPSAASAGARLAPATVAPRAALTPVAPPGALALGAGGKVPGRVRRAVARANAPPVHNPFPANFDRLAGGAFVALLVVSAVGMWMGITTRREAGGLEVPAGVEVGVRTSGVAEAPEAPSSAPDVPPAGQGDRLVRPPRSPSESVIAEDTLRLRDGTVRTGRVMRITHEAVLLRDLWSDTVGAVDLDEVLEFRARAGAVVPVGGSDAAPATDAFGRAVLRAADPVGAPDQAEGVESALGVSHAGASMPGAAPGPGAGFGGRYEVRQSLLEVQGTESCDVVGDAVRRASTRPTVEVVAHRAGAPVFDLVSRPGVRGTVDPDGRFRTEAIRGVRDGVHYWFRMTGQFDAAGFRAEAESATDAVLKFGSVQRCRVTAALDARRLP